MRAARLPGGPLVASTIGMAVADLEASMAAYEGVLGWGPWRVYHQRPPALREMRYRGADAEFSFLVAGTQAPGGFAFWLCQALDGPSLYRDLVDEGLPGPHFVTVWRQTQVESDAVRAWCTDHGAAELMSARLEGSIEFAFYDTRPLLGTILETGHGRSDAQPLAATSPGSAE
jgi:hypothetical protein